MKKRLLSILLAFSLTVGMLTATVLPAMGGVQTPQGVAPLANQTWIEVVGDSAPETGYTISGNTVKISSAQGLAWLAKQVNEGTESFADKTVLLTQAIDLSGYEWVPIGTQSHPFNGTFDGQSYTISGMGITVSGNNTVAGLFGCISNGTVQNVKLAGAKITGEVTGSTEYYIGGIAAANKAMRSKDANKITVTNCEVELEITLNASSTAGVYIGGIIGWTDSNWSGSGAEIKSTTSDLTLDYTGAIKNYNAYVGGFIGRIGNYNGSFTIEECSGLLDGKISSGFSPKDLSIGGAFGYSSSSSSPADNKPDYMQIKSSNVVSRLDFLNASAALNATFMSCTDMGGFIGTGCAYSTITDSFASIVVDSEKKNNFFGNIVGNTNSATKTAVWENVYTYAVQAGGQQSKTSSSSNYNYAEYKDVYYIVPNPELKIGAESAPFDFISMKDGQEITEDINRNFTYTDGDASDGLTVTAAGDKITIAGEISGESASCAVTASNQTAGISFTFPLTVLPGDSAPRYDIETEIVDNNGFCKLEVDQVGPVEAGKTVTVTATPVPNDTSYYGGCFMLDYLKVTDSEGKTVLEKHTEKGELGEKVYTFEMPESDVTVTAKFRMAEEHLSMSPEKIVFGPVTEGYTKPPAAQTVTLTNDGDIDTTVNLDKFESYKSYYTLTPLSGNWNGRQVILKAGETAAFTAQPNLGLSVSDPDVNNRIKVFIYNNSISYIGVVPLYLTLECTVVKAEPILITPADITIYTGGEGYSGVVDESGEIAGAYLENGFPEPGYFITLPDSLNDQLGGEEEAANLANLLTFRYDDGKGTTREWKLALYGTTENSTDIEAGGEKRPRYIYKLLPSTEQQIPVRLEITDPETGSFVLNDEFTPSLDEKYKEYDMTIYAGALDQNLITAELVIGEDTYVCPVQVDTGKLTVRGLNNESTTGIVTEEESVTAGNITALAPDDAAYYVNGSNVEVRDTTGVKLLVDEVLDDTVLIDYIQDKITDIPSDGYGYVQRYLDLVDTKNGNAYLTMGDGQKMTIYWPVPEDIKLDGTHYVIHFDALDRNYDDMEAELSANTPEKILASPVTIEGKHYVKFETGSFSPFVLVYEKTDPVITEYSLTVENGTGDGRYETGEQVTITADTAPAGKVFDKWVLTEGGGTLENAEASTTVFTMPAGDAIVTATYKNHGGGTDEPEAEKYGLTVENGTGDGRYEAGEQVTITADAAPAGKVFDKWVLTEGGGTLENAEASTTVFTMPAGDATVTATYKNHGGGTDEPEAEKYSLTVENGTGDGRYEAGEQVTITADAAPAGKVFDKWVLTEGGGTLENAEASTTIFTMPAGDATVTARYRDGDEEPIQHIITATAGEGGSISPAGTVPVLAGGRQTFEILSDEGFVIDKLLIDGVEITDATGKADFNYSFTSVTKNHTITVAFHPEGGTVESENPSIPSGSVSTPDEGGSSSSLEDYGVSSGPDPMPQTGGNQNLNLWLILLLLSIIGMTITVAGSSKRRHARGRHMR